jgi:hypothetical protein
VATPEREADFVVLPFAVTVEFAPAHATVAATASNSVVIHRERRHPQGRDVLDDRADRGSCGKRFF